MPAPLGEKVEIEETNNADAIVKTDQNNIVGGASEEFNAVKEGGSLAKHGDNLTNDEVEVLSDQLEDSEFEEKYLREASEHLEKWNIDVNPEELKLTVASSKEDVSHIDEYVDLTRGAGYHPEENEVLLLAYDPKMISSKSNSFSLTVHELKHHDQDNRRNKDNPAVKEAMAHLISTYMSGDIDDEYQRMKRKNSLEDSDYPENEQLAEEFELALNVYDNLVETGQEEDEALSFILNEYEERRWNLD